MYAGQLKLQTRTQNNIIIAFQRQQKLH